MTKANSKPFPTEKTEAHTNGVGVFYKQHKYARQKCVCVLRRRVWYREGERRRGKAGDTAFWGTFR